MTLKRFTRRAAIETAVKHLGVAAVAGMGAAGTARAQTVAWYREPHPEVEGRYLAIDNVCAYASVATLEDGTLMAGIFSQPTHGGPKGDIACWASEDGGRFWKFRGVAAQHEPGFSHIRNSIGTAHDGSLLVLAQTEKWREDRFRERGAPTLVCRSADGGWTWQRSSTVTAPADAKHLIPYGNIIRGPGTTLAAPAWDLRRRKKFKQRLGDRAPSVPTGEGAEAVSYMLFSHDDGRTWDDAVLIGEPGPKAGWFGSTVAVRLRSGRWLAAVDKWSHVALFVSEDEGRQWTEAGPLTAGGLRHRPGHLLELADGRVLLTFGVREREHFGHPNDLPGFVRGTLFRRRVRAGSGLTPEDLPPRSAYEDEPWYAHYGWGRGMAHGPGCPAIRWSEDEGDSWSAPRIVAHLEESTDGSYPATAQHPDGTLVTVYHADRMPGHHRFHMGAIRWSLPSRKS